VVIQPKGSGIAQPQEGTGSYTSYEITDISRCEK